MSQPTALDPFDWREVVLAAGAVLFTLWGMKKIAEVTHTYEGLPESADHPSHMPVLKSHELDTRGEDSITHHFQPKAGSYGGHKSKHIHNTASTGYVNSLTNRAATYHPFASMQKDEARKAAFEQMYTARIHQ